MISPSPSSTQPGQPGSGSPLGGRQFDVVQRLAPVRRAIGLGRIARGVLLGFAAGAAAGACVLVAAHIWGFSLALLAGSAAAALGAVAGAALGIARWPQPLEAARAADSHFELNDRLTTALELRSSNQPIAIVQRRDAAHRVEGLALAKSRSRWLGWREGAVTALAVLALAGAIALGTQRQPHHTAVAASAGTQSARRAAAAQIHRLATQLHLGLTRGQQQSLAVRKLDLALARLRRQLLQASTPRTALRAISATQQQLRHLARGLHPINAKAISQLNGSLGRYLGKGQAQARSGASTRSALATAQALNRLAQTLAHLTPAQRAALARALAKAANTTSSNSLRQALRQAASALANGAPQSARAALQQAAQALAQTPGARAALSRLGTAGNQLSALKNQLSGVAGTIPPRLLRAASAASSRSGTRVGSGLGRGRGSRSGKGARAGAGTQPGTGSRPGNGQGRGQGTGSARDLRPGAGLGRGVVQAALAGLGVSQAQGTSGARGPGGQGRQSGLLRRGQTATVFVPSRQGNGKQTIQSGPTGSPEPGLIVPYHQVVGQYTQSAHLALDRAGLPPALQQYVRQYFNSLSH